MQGIWTRQLGEWNYYLGVENGEFGFRGTHYAMSQAVEFRHDVGLRGMNWA